MDEISMRTPQLIIQMEIPHYNSTFKCRPRSLPSYNGIFKSGPQQKIIKHSKPHPPNTIIVYFHRHTPYKIIYSNPHPDSSRQRCVVNERCGQWGGGGGGVQIAVDNATQ